MSAIASMTCCKPCFLIAGTKHRDGRRKARCANACLSVLLLLIAFSYVAINLGSKDKVPLAKIALPLLVVCMVVYLASSWLAPLVNFLMQLWTHLRLP
jgi:hypothetical protein